MNLDKLENSTQIRVYQEMYQRYQIELTDEQLQTIDDVYIEERKHAVFKVGMYRFLNFLISLVMIIVFFILRKTGFDTWVFLLLMTAFGGYNAIHCFNNIMDYKSIKRSNFKPFNVERGD